MSKTGSSVDVDLLKSTFDQDEKNVTKAYRFPPALTERIEEIYATEGIQEMRISKSELVCKLIELGIDQISQ